MYHKGLLIYAIDSQNNFVSIENVTNGLDCNCFCPSCKERLMAKNGGKKNSHHFAHASGVDCEGAYETMLHKLAKKKVQEAFLNKSEFYIQFKHTSYCPNAKSCGFIRYDDCFTSTNESFNLKDYYDSCEQEIKYDSINRRSDLKIFSSKHPNRLPIYIEFCVTHASDDFKLDNGGKIIEIKIESESDIDRIVENGFIETIRYDEIDMSFEEIVDTNNISFRNFKTRDYNNSHICHEIEISRYILYSSGKSYCYKEVLKCRHLAKSRKKSLLEICFHNPTALRIFEMAIYQGYKMFGIKNCLYCRNYINDDIHKSVCWLVYKENKTNQIEPLDTAEAKECPHFIINEDKMNEELERFNSLKPTEYTIFY